MKLHAITISLTDGKGHVVLADQAHDEAVSCRVELTFPLGAKPEEGFAGREQGSRMSLARDDLEHVGVVPGSLLAPAP